MIEQTYVYGYKLYKPIDLIDTGGAINEDADLDLTNWTIYYGNFPAHIRQLTANEIVINEKREVKATHRMYCNSSLSINAKDRIVDPDSRTFDVKFIDDPHQLGCFLQVDLELRV